MKPESLCISIFLGANAPLVPASSEGLYVCLSVCLYVFNTLAPLLSPPLQDKDKETKRQRDKETKRQRDKETKRQRDKETERQIDKETKRQRDKEIERQCHCVTERKLKTRMFLKCPIG